MERIQIFTSPATPYIPNVDFSEEDGMCSIKGDSYMEEPKGFYSPLIDWIKNYLQIHDVLKIRLELNYYNTTTTKYLLNMFDILRENITMGKKISIEWLYPADDSDLKAEIDDFEADAGVEIKKIAI